jgi:hypothetical protein
MKKQAAEPAQEQGSGRDIFDTLYNPNDRSVCPPRQIGGCYISQSQAAALNIPKTAEKDREQK